MTYKSIESVRCKICVRMFGDRWKVWTRYCFFGCDDEDMNLCKHLQSRDCKSIIHQL